MKSLRGKVALVTGASRGIGPRIAERLAAEGMDVAVVARSAAPLERAAERVRDRGMRALSLPLDLGGADACREAVRRVEAELGPVAVLVNNAAVEYASAFPDLTPTEITQIAHVNLVAPMLLIREVLPGMLGRGEGHVVNVASVAGKAPTPYNEPYGASKAGLVNLTHGLRASYGDRGVGFSVLCPGFIRGEGMYARMEEQGTRAPGFLGTVDPDRFVDVLVRAIRRDLAEVTLNPTPLAPLMVAAAISPSLIAPLLRWTGIRRFFSDVAERRKKGS